MLIGCKLIKRLTQICQSRAQNPNMINDRLHAQMLKSH